MILNMNDNNLTSTLMSVKESTDMVQLFKNNIN